MRVNKGDRAKIVDGIFGVNVGKIVEVLEYMGGHTMYGPIWRVRTLGAPLVTEYGAVGITCDCADEWLEKLPPTTPPQKMIDEELLAA